MVKDDRIQHALEVMGRALEIEYQTIVHSPRLAKMMPDEGLASKVEILARDSIKHADIVATTISQLGGIPPYPHFEPLADPVDLKGVFHKQLELENLALSLHNEAARSLEEELASSLRQVAEQERWHITLVEEIISKLD